VESVDAIASSVIPAKAGIQSYPVGSRLRENDGNATPSRDKTLSMAWDARTMILHPP